MLSSYVPSVCVGTVAVSEDGGVMEAVSFVCGMLSSIIFYCVFQHYRHGSGWSAT